MLKTLICVASILALSACVGILPEPHKIEIQQGTLLEPELVDQLQIGMTREQVTFLLGSPTLQDVFHPERWDYLFYRDTHAPTTAPDGLTLYFEEQKLVRINNRLKANTETPAQAAPN